MPVFGHMRACKGGRAQANGVNLGQTDFRVNYVGEDVDTSSFESLGFEQGTIGFKRLDYSSNGLWNSQTDPLDSPGIFPTDSMANLYFYISTSDNLFWLMPLARILSAENSAMNLKTGAVAFNFSGKSQSTFTVPTGSV